MGSAVCQRRTAMVGGEIKRFGHSADSGVKCGLATGNSLSTLGLRADAAGPVPTASPLMRMDITIQDAKGLVLSTLVMQPMMMMMIIDTTKGKRATRFEDGVY